MPLIKNYTTKIATKQSLGEVTELLSRRGVSRISTLLDETGAPEGIAFTMQTEHGRREFELPVRVDGVRAYLARAAANKEFPTSVKPNELRTYLTPEHAARVAWRIAKDWLEAQAALIDADLASMDEVMFPYMVTPGGKTMFARYSNEQKGIEA